MKSIIFKILIVLLIVGGIFMYATKGKYFNELTDFFSSNEILPKEEWESVLIGKWEIESITKSTNGILRLKGNVEYKKDKTLVKYINLKYYEKTNYEEVIEKKGHLKIESGGKIEGIWSISKEENCWIETIIDCSGKPSHNRTNEAEIISHCSFFKKGESYEYGTFNSLESKDKIIKFSHDKIVIEGQDFNNDGKEIYTLTHKY